MLFKNDESFILKELVKKKQYEIVKCIDKAKGKKVEDPDIDKMHRHMVHSIYEAIYENLDINETIFREREVLYKGFTTGIANSMFKNVRISLSLGSSILSLTELVIYIGKINIKGKVFKGLDPYIF